MSHHEVDNDSKHPDDDTIPPRPTERSNMSDLSGLLVVGGGQSELKRKSHESHISLPPPPGGQLDSLELQLPLDMAARKTREQSSRNDLPQRKYNLFLFGQTWKSDFY